MSPVLLALERAESYVAGAYLAFGALLLIYIAIMAAKLSRIQRELREVADSAEGWPASRAASSASRPGAAKGEEEG